MSSLVCNSEPSLSTRNFNYKHSASFSFRLSSISARLFSKSSSATSKVSVRFSKAFLFSLRRRISLDFSDSICKRIKISSSMPWFLPRSWSFSKSPSLIISLSLVSFSFSSLFMSFSFKSSFPKFSSSSKAAPSFISSSASLANPFLNSRSISKILTFRPSISSSYFLFNLNISSSTISWYWSILRFFQLWIMCKASSLQASQRIRRYSLNCFQRTRRSKSTEAVVERARKVVLSWRLDGVSLSIQYQNQLVRQNYFRFLFYNNLSSILNRIAQLLTPLIIITSHMSTQFIFQDSSFYLNVEKGQQLTFTRKKLREQFNTSTDKQLVICSNPMGQNTISGILLIAPLKKQLPVAYCYQISLDQYTQYFRRITVVDDATDDTPELEFLVYISLTVKELESMYQFTKDTSVKSFGFVTEDTNQPVPLETQILTLPQGSRLKIFPNLVRVLLHVDGKEEEKARIRGIMFTKNTARNLVKRLFPDYQQKCEHARVFFNYYGVDIPEDQLLIPEKKDEVVICMKMLDSPVTVIIKQAKSGNILTKRLVERDTIYYRTAKQISHLFPQVKAFSNYSFENDDSGKEYYKEEEEVVILVGNQIKEELESILKQNVSKRVNENFSITKQRLKAVFENDEDEGKENEEIFGILALYARVVLDQ